MIKIIDAKKRDASLIAQIAAPIWKEHYTSIISYGQIVYMLDKFQSEQAIIKQINQGLEYFIVYKAKEPIGYMAIEQRERHLFISKFYLNLANRGKGIARIMLDKINLLAHKKHCHQMELTVNKRNPAYHIYLKLGFKKVNSIKIDIGNGYFMDDYHLIKSIEASN